jgi:shikimate dehydrogenase
MSLVPTGSFGELWAEVSLDSKAKSGVLFDVAYNPWPSTAALAWGSATVISGIEMLIWQAIEQVEHFVAAAGVDKLIDRDMLYEVMKKAVSGK